MKYYKLIGSGWDWMKTNTIYPEDWADDRGNNLLMGMEVYPKEFELSTKAEYNKQEGIVPKPRVKKVVITPCAFKVGYKVEFIGKGTSMNSTYYDDKTCVIGGIYTVNLVDSESIKLEEDKLKFWLYSEHFKLSTQTKLKQTKMENYSIEGSKALKTAFVEECGLKTYNSSTLDCRLLTSVSVPVGTVQGGAETSRHFVLPKDWDKAVAYVKEFNTPKPVLPVYKVGDWVTILKSDSNWTDDMNKYVGTTVQIISINNTGYKGGTDITFKDSNCWTWSSYSKHYRLATPAEIKKATTPVVFKAGDVVVITGNTNSSVNKVGDIGVILPKDCSLVNWRVETSMISTTNWTIPAEMRLATPAEIKKFKLVERFKACDYTAELSKGKVIFGCKTITKEQVKAVIDSVEICSYVGRSATITSTGLTFSDGSKLDTAQLTKIYKSL